MRAVCSRTVGPRVSASLTSFQACRMCPAIRVCDDCADVAPARYISPLPNVMIAYQMRAMLVGCIEQYIWGMITGGDATTYAIWACKQPSISAMA